MSAVDVNKLETAKHCFPKTMSADCADVFIGENDAYCCEGFKAMFQLCYLVLYLMATIFAVVLVGYIVCYLSDPSNHNTGFNDLKEVNDPSLINNSDMHDIDDSSLIKFVKIKWPENTQNRAIKGLYYYNAKLYVISNYFIQQYHIYDEKWSELSLDPSMDSICYSTTISMNHLRIYFLPYEDISLPSIDLRTNEWIFDDLSEDKIREFILQYMCVHSDLWDYKILAMHRFAQILSDIKRDISLPWTFAHSYKLMYIHEINRVYLFECSTNKLEITFKDINTEHNHQQKLQHQGTINLNQQPYIVLVRFMTRLYLIIIDWIGGEIYSIDVLSGNVVKHDKRLNASLIDHLCYDESNNDLYCIGKDENYLYKIRVSRLFPFVVLLGYIIDGFVREYENYFYLPDILKQMVCNFVGNKKAVENRSPIADFEHILLHRRL